MSAAKPVILFFRWRYPAHTQRYTLAKANPHHGRDGRFSFAQGEMPGLLDKPAIRITWSRNQVRPDERLSEAGARAKREIMRAFAEAGGTIRNRDSRHPFRLTGKSAAHLVHLGERHLPFKEHIEAAFCLPQLIRRAVLAERYQDRKDDNPNLYIARYYAPFSCDGMLYRAKLTVFEYRGADKAFKLYDHALSEIELDPLQKTNPAQGGVSRKAGFLNGERDHAPSTFDAGNPLRSPASFLTIGQMLAGVNRDTDGRPFGTSL